VSQSIWKLLFVHNTAMQHVIQAVAHIPLICTLVWSSAQSRKSIQPMRVLMLHSQLPKVPEMIPHAFLTWVQIVCICSH
jgi:hypothetical protein